LEKTLNERKENTIHTEHNTSKTQLLIPDYLQCSSKRLMFIQLTMCIG